MFSRPVAITLFIAVLCHNSEALSQEGPLQDPIPRPIPQSHVRISLVPVITGITCPISMTVIKGDPTRAFVVDQTGVILIIKNGAVQPSPFLDITALLAQLAPAFPSAPNGVNPGYDERGLLGLAFHPGYLNSNNPGFRTLYTLHNVPTGRRADFVEPPFPNDNVVPNCQEVIAEWKADATNPDVVDPNSYREILRYDKPQFNHNGGTIAFGTDGLLYGAFGDGGAANDVADGHNPATGNAQDLTTILGKMIRINPLDPILTTDADGDVSSNGQYRNPNTNPFMNTPGALREIYAYGFRNPYRFSFDASDGRLVLGDVGQNNIEEIDIVTSGGNYGWNILEGKFLFDPSTGNVFTNPIPHPNLVPPVVQYDHFEATAGAVTRIAIVGGFVYRGTQIRGLGGKYITGDLTGPLLVADLQSGKLERLSSNVGMFIKGFGQDADNELYVLGSTDLGPSGANGKVLKISLLSH